MLPALVRLPLFCFSLCLCVSTHAQTAPVFDVLEFEVRGNSVLADAQIERSVTPFLGYDRKFQDVEGARAALEQAYQDNGYLSVSVKLPEQALNEGVIVLQVEEGKVERLKVSGNQYSTRSEIREQVPSLAAGSVPHFPVMQEELGRLASLQDRQITPLMRAGRTPSTMDVELAVDESSPLHGSVELNNRQSPDTEKYRLEGTLRYDNLFQKGHSASLYYVTTPQNRNEVEVMLGSYFAPIGEGRKVGGFWLRSNSNIATAADSGVVGKGDIVGLRLSQALRTPSDMSSFYHSLMFGVDYRHFDETQTIVSSDTKSTALRYRPVSLQYSYGGQGNVADWNGNLTPVFGLRGKSQHDVECSPGVFVDQFECRRAGARGNFSILRGDMALTRRYLGWEGLARMDFQTTAQPLISNEQFIAGGVDSVRGYYEGEVAGDVGWRFRGEVKTPALAEAASSTVRGVAFLDTAFLKLKDPLPGQKDEWRLSGTGLGLRLEAPKGIKLNIDWARALTNGAETLTGYRTKSGDNRVHVRLSSTF